MVWGLAELQLGGSEAESLKKNRGQMQDAGGVQCWKDAEREVGDSQPGQFCPGTVHIHTRQQDRTKTVFSC